MSLMKRSRSELDWPEWPEWPGWLAARRLLDWPEGLFGSSGEAAPLRVEQFEDDGALVVRAELAGVDPDKDVEITISDHTLRIKAERREEKTEQDKKGFRSEFRYGSFVRTLPLPAGATSDDVKASYIDGVLEVRVPINAAQAAATTIPIART